MNRFIICLAFCIVSAFIHRMSAATDSSGNPGGVSIQIEPEDGSMLYNLESGVALTFPFDVMATDGSVAVSIGGNIRFELSLAVEGNVATVDGRSFPLYTGSECSIIFPRGLFTAFDGKWENDDFSVTYGGSLPLPPSPPLYVSIDFDDPYTAMAGTYLYDGDGNTPVDEMKALGFDNEGSAWNYSVRDNDNHNCCAASHSMYTPRGCSDDWMILRPISLGSRHYTLSFRHQSYRRDAVDRLKVIVWPCDDVMDEFHAEDIRRMREEGTVVFDEVLSPGNSEETLEGDWEDACIPLGRFINKTVYIAFVNENDDQSAVFVDDIKVRETGPRVSLIREDRVWEYVDMRHFGEACSMFRMKFDGTSTHHGREYHNLRYVGDRVDFRYDYEDGSCTDVRTSRNPDTVYYMREEYGRVYLLYSPDYLVYDEELNGAGIGGTPLAEGDEVLLYDFNVTHGQSYESICQAGPVYGFAEYYVGDVRYMDIAGEECLVQRMERHSDRNPSLPPVMIEGIGITDYGYLPCPETYDMTTGGDFTLLNKVLDSGDKVVYTGYGLDNPWMSSVEAIGSDVPADTRIYDLHGREVVRPQRGSIYIRGGKKLVW